MGLLKHMPATRSIDDLAASRNECASLQVELENVRRQLHMATESHNKTLRANAMLQSKLERRSKLVEMLRKELGKNNA